MSMCRTFLALALVIAAAPVFADPPAKAPAKKTAGAKTAAAPAKPCDAKTSDTVCDHVAKQFVEFFDRLTNIVTGNEENCAKMAELVNAHVDANQALIKQIADLKSQNKSLPEDAKQKIAKKSAEVLAPAMMKKCSNDRAVMTAFLRIKPEPARTPEQERERLRERLREHEREERERQK